MRRIKLNDRVTFPLYLTLNRFLKEDYTTAPPTPSSEPPSQLHDNNNNNNSTSNHPSIEEAEHQFSENSEDEEFDQVERGFPNFKVDSDSENSEDIPSSSGRYEAPLVSLPGSGEDGEEMQEIALSKRKKLAGAHASGLDDVDDLRLGDHVAAADLGGKSEIEDMEAEPWRSSKNQQLPWNSNRWNQGGAGSHSSNHEYYNTQHQTSHVMKKRESLQINREEAEAALKDGPFVFELYSVLVHRGNALGRKRKRKNFFFF
jgi:hypothetical protein